MKTLMLTLCSLLILASCGQEDTSTKFNIEEQTEIIKKDPVFLEYHEAKEALAKLVTESETLDFQKYVGIINIHYPGVNRCDVNKDIFMGDAEMAQLLDIQCKVSITKIAFRDKYPEFFKLPTEERSQFYTDINMPFNYDMESVKRKADKEVERLQAEGYDLETIKRNAEKGLEQFQVEN